MNEDDENDLIFLEVKIPKYLPTQQIEVDVQPLYV